MGPWWSRSGGLRGSAERRCCGRECARVSARPVFRHGTGAPLPQRCTPFLQSIIPKCRARQPCTFDQTRHARRQAGRAARRVAWRAQRVAQLSGQHHATNIPPLPTRQCHAADATVLPNPSADSSKTVSLLLSSQAKFPRPQRTPSPTLRRLRRVVTSRSTRGRTRARSRSNARSAT